MLKVLKNLKKSIGAVIIIVILLCIQAAADLALPDYTSKIVNTGIQAGGIENGVPEIISKENMDQILFFTDNPEEILNYYELVGNRETKHQEKVIDKYLGKDYEVSEDEIYVQKDLDEEELQALEDVMVTPIMELRVVTNEETANQIKSNILENVPESQKSYIENMGVLEILETLPE